MVKKLLCVILLITIILTNFSTTVIAMNENDVITVLEDLGIAQSVRFAYFHKYYTRLEFAKMICAMDISYYPGQEEMTVLTDVTGTGVSYATHVLRQQYMTLDIEGNFRPYMPVTYEDAIKALVTLRGYNAIAEENGGTMADYIFAAQRAGLLSGVNIADENCLSRNELAKMIFNSLGEKSTEISDENFTLPGTTILDDMGIHTGISTLLANENLGIGADICRTGYVNLDGEIYATQKEVSNSLVGKRVRYYIQEQNNNTLKVVSLVDESGESVIIKAGELYDVTFGAKEIQFKYGDGKRMKIPYTATVLVNGKVADLTSQLLNAFKSGKMEIFDGDNDGSFDTVVMYACKTEIVEGAGSSTNTIVTRYTKRQISLNSLNNNLVIYENDERTTMSAIKSGSVINIACDSYNFDDSGNLVFNYNTAKNVTIYVSNRAALGELTSITNDSYELGGKKYDTSTVFSSVLTSSMKNKPTIGRTYRFYLDSFGNVCDFEESDAEGSMKYGYIMRVGLTKGLSPKLQIRILNNNNEYENLYVNDHYILDCEPKKGDNIPTALSIGRQLVRYKASDGKIVEIDTLTKSPEETDDTSITEDVPLTNCRWLHNMGGFENFKIMADADTQVFWVSDDPDAGESDFKAGTYNDFGTSLQYFDVEGYDVGKLGKTGCILVHEPISAGATFTDHTIRSYLVGNAIQVINAQGESVYRFELYGYGGKKTLETIESSSVTINVSNGNLDGTRTKVSDIKKGDVIRFVQNPRQQITDIDCVFIPKETTNYYNITIPPSGLQYAYGILYQGDKKYFEFTTNPDLVNLMPSDKYVFGYNFAKDIPVYNMTTNTVELISGDFSDIPSYVKNASQVNIFMHYGAYELFSAVVYAWE